LFVQRRSQLQNLFRNCPNTLPAIIIRQAIGLETNLKAEHFFFVVSASESKKKFFFLLWSEEIRCVQRESSNMGKEEKASESSSCRMEISSFFFSLEEFAD
jgi:hypothetical protein